MNKKLVINRTAKFIKDKLFNEESGHDWWHIYRVWQIAKKIGNEEKADLFVIELAALLHDIADWKFQEGNDETIGITQAKEWLENLNVPQGTISHITSIIKSSSFKGAKVKDNLDTIEGKIVQDADRLDAIGAIGIARCFAYGGNKGRQIYDPAIKPQLHLSFQEYKNNLSSSINHFYEKLLLLKNRMNTKMGKRLAINRHKHMEVFLKEFFDEWVGNK